MIDNEQQIDHAEHAAVRAEQTAEQAAEQAHLDLQSEYVRRLLIEGNLAHVGAQLSALRLREEIDLRQAPNMHRYELLAREQHVALLAPTVANALEESHSYDLLAVASGVCEAYRLQHTHARARLGDASSADRALDGAVSRVLDTVAEVLREDRDRFAAEAAEQAAVEDHELILARRDAGIEP